MYVFKLSLIIIAHGEYAVSTSHKNRQKCLNDNILFRIEMAVKAKGRNQIK